METGEARSFGNSKWAVTRTWKAKTAKPLPLSGALSLSFRLHTFLSSSLCMSPSFLSFSEDWLALLFHARDHIWWGHQNLTVIWLHWLNSQLGILDLKFKFPGERHFVWLSVAMQLWSLGSRPSPQGCGGTFVLAQIQQSVRFWESESFCKVGTKRVW